MAKPLDMNYCPCCGQVLIDKFIFGRVRRKCPECGLVFFRDPRVAAGVLAEQDGKVVLVKRLYDPHTGDWALPVRFVEINEGPVQFELLSIPRKHNGRSRSGSTVVYSDTLYCKITG